MSDKNIGAKFLGFYKRAKNISKALGRTLSFLNEKVYKPIQPLVEGVVAAIPEVGIPISLGMRAASGVVSGVGDKLGFDNSTGVSGLFKDLKKYLVDSKS